MKRRRVFLVIAVAAACVVSIVPGAAIGSTGELANSAYRLVVEIAADGVKVGLDDKRLGLRVADGPYRYFARRSDADEGEVGLHDASVVSEGTRLTIHGRLAGLDAEHAFDLPTDRPIMEERISVRNSGNSVVSLADMQFGFTRTVADAAGNVRPELADDRSVAVPFRARPDDAKGHYNDFSTADLINTKGYEVRVRFDTQAERVLSDRRQSDGWAWTHGDNTLGIFKLDQENMQWSVLAVDHTDRTVGLRFGGVCMVDGEPSDLSRIQSGQTVRLGLTRFETVRGGWQMASYAYRAFLDEHGCRFPKGFNPPVHWEQLYDMEGAWDDRLHKYTKAIVEREADKGVAYGCESLYLDPGWDTDFATFVWGKDWLGPAAAFVDEMKSKYGLKVSLHVPLAPWMSIGWAMGGNSAPGTYPAEARRKPPQFIDPTLKKTPDSERGHRNLAFLPEAKANASSIIADGNMPIHQISHLNDGWCGNRASWIAKTAAAWAEIDLGQTHVISRVRLTNDAGREYADRKAVDYRILTATEYNADSNADSWAVAAEVTGEPLLGVREFSFAPRKARWVRVEILGSEPNEPRLDEIEVYEEAPLPDSHVQEWRSQVRRRTIPAGASTVCIGAKAYLDEAAKRLLANCADGVAFLMYDGNWYQGGCQDRRMAIPCPLRRKTTCGLVWSLRVGFTTSTPTC